MTALPKSRSEEVFEDFKPPYDEKQARVEANRCLFCFDAPCIKVCPTGIDIPSFIRKIATGNTRGSARTIFESNILGMSCARVCPVEVLCVGDCVYNHMGVPPIQIGKLQRYATDKAYEAEWEFYEAGPDTGKSVALIGAGPASLACAHLLRRHGHACTIYEKRTILGGLNSFGVAPYKMNAERALQEVDWVLSIGGIELKTGVEIPRDITWQQILDKHDAVFIGFGLGPDSRLESQSENISGVHGAVDFIEKFKLGTVDLKSVKRALVLGGGNTALDCVRELRGLGVADVNLVYRGDESQMSGYAHEWAAAKVEGAQAHWRTQPVSFKVESGRVVGVNCLKVDENKKPIAGTEHLVAGDLVLLALGQSKLGELVAGLSGVQVEKGRVVVVRNGQTGHEKVYAGGDCANGGKEVVNAVAEGRDAAMAIHERLSQCTKGGQ